LAKNIEIKARVTDYNEQRSRAETLSDSAPEELIQEDTFFHVTEGRLKLREFPNDPAQLIFYNRGNDKGPKLSDYQISVSDDGNSLKAVLEKAYGIRSIVKKVRILYLAGRTRIHFDNVEGLGQFIELEVVLNNQESLAKGQQEAENLMTALNIQPSDLVDVAYVDLLERQK